MYMKHSFIARTYRQMSPSMHIYISPSSLYSLGLHYLREHSGLTYLLAYKQTRNVLNDGNHIN